MKNDRMESIRIYFGWVVKRLALMLYDIFAVNLSCFLALVLRFYVNNEFRTVAAERYIPALSEYAPYYTAACVAVFVLLRMYDSRWKYAGLRDMNRIFLANAITAVIHVAGTLLWFDRMPISYYFISACLQFFMVAASRFSYRLLVMESTRWNRRQMARMNVMIVGIGETAQILRRQIEGDTQNVARPVCIFSYKDPFVGRMMNGLPILTDADRLPEYFEKYKIKCVILADPLLPVPVRQQVKELCRENHVEVQDFSAYLVQKGPGLAPQLLLEHMAGPVRLIVDGAAQTFESGEAAMLALKGNCTVKRISAEGGRLVVELTGAGTVLNDVHKEWVKDTERETGKEISFF